MEIDIERQIENIPDPQTKQYFESVFQLYCIKNYRACIVMLWSCIVYDLLHKLDKSIVLYDDGIAKSILETVNDEMAGVNFKPDWEKRFISELKTRTKFFSEIAFRQINEIHEHRHWCAHPTVDKYELYSPSKDLCRDHMSQALNIVLLRPPFMTKKFTDIILNSLAVLKYNGYDYATVGRYWDEKYLKNIPVDLNNKLFHDLWHIVFCVENDEEAVQNREIGMWLIRHLIDLNPQLLDLLSSDPGYYSRISLQADVLIVFFTLVAYYPIVWDKISEPSKTLLQTEINKNHILDYLAYVVDGGIKPHFQKLKDESYYEDSSICSPMKYSEIDCLHMDLLFELIDDNETMEVFCEFLIKIHTSSRSFDDANMTFEQIIMKSIHHYSSVSIERLLQGINANDQCYNRRAMYDALRDIHRICQQKGFSINPALYPNIPHIRLVFNQEIDG